MLPYGVSPHDLRKTGWGLIFPSKWTESERSGWLRRLINRRRMQLGEEPKTFVPPRSGKADDFLAFLGETAGTIRLDKLPYYVFLVASPEEIPFDFQYHLSLSRAVGRIWFPDAAGYQAYSESVVQAEEHGVSLPREVRLVSPDEDEVTHRLGDALIDPVHRMLASEHPDWGTLVLRKQATSRQRLQALLGGGQTPALLLASGHGRSYPMDDPEQEHLQGGFVCYPEDDQEDEEADLNADHLSDTPKDLHGLLAFFFSCYGAGVPKHSSFPHHGKDAEAVRLTEPVRIAQRAFLSKLSMELLRKGALAVVGHVDRGWSCSFQWTRGHLDLNTTASLEDSLNMLLRGHRLGHAMRPLNRRYQQLAARLANQLDDERTGTRHHDADLGFNWTAVNDARNLIILGDPAVYLLGQRQVENMIRLDPELFRQIERRVSESQMDLETWVERALKRFLY